MVSYRGAMTIYFKIRYIWGKHFIIFSRRLDYFFKIQLFSLVLYPNTLPDELCGSICSYYMHNIINGIIQMPHDHLFQKSDISGKQGWKTKIQKISFFSRIIQKLHYQMGYMDPFVRITCISL